jgi:hypothetical protein
MVKANSKKLFSSSSGTRKGLKTSPELDKNSLNQPNLINDKKQIEHLKKKIEELLKDPESARKAALIIEQVINTPSKK